jgi:myo-inositol-1(or 4)-monophosphatase
MSELLAVAEQAARAAGELLVERYWGRAGVEVAAKSTTTDMVSEADHEAERCVRAVLAEHAPDDGIVGEEGDDVPSRTGRLWVVDPLDGTTNFLFGNPQWCVSVACEGEVGVVFDPLRDELFAAARSGPATLNGVALPPPDAAELPTALVATGFGYDAAQRREQARVLVDVVAACRDVRRAGSAALDLAWAAAGRVDAYYEHGVQRWDTAAGLVLCAAAGLEVRPLRPRDGLPAGVLVSPPRLADALQRLVDSII